MRLIVSNTPIKKCRRSVLYTQTMIDEFDDEALMPMKAQLQSPLEVLLAAEDRVEEAQDSLTVCRMRVRWADYKSDKLCRAIYRAAQGVDEEYDSAIAALLFPGGVVQLVRLLGRSQVRKMREAEGRLATLNASWPESVEWLAKLQASREHYEARLAAREEATLRVSDLRARRNMDKEDLIDVFNEVANRIKIRFPRNRTLQDLFFDRVSVASTKSKDQDSKDQDSKDQDSKDQDSSDESTVVSA